MSGLASSIYKEDGGHMRHPVQLLWPLAIPIHVAGTGKPHVSLRRAMTGGTKHTAVPEELFRRWPGQARRKREGTTGMRPMHDIKLCSANAKQRAVSSEQWQYADGMKKLLIMASF